jgi:hypothetical protein
MWPLLATLLALVSFTSPAAATRVQLRGGSRIQAAASRSGGKLEVRGQLLDDGGNPFHGEHVLATLTASSTEAQSAVAAGLASATTCSARDATSVSHRGGALDLRTDEQGRFCVLVTLPPLPFVVKLAYAGGPLVGGADADLPVDLGRRTLALAFAPTPRVVSLDEPVWTVAVVASTQEDGSLHGEGGIAVALENEHGKTIATATTDSGGRASFRVDTAELGPPGKGEVRARFDGNEAVGNTKVSFPIDRRAHVQVTLDGPVPSGVAEEGIPIAVQVKWRGGVVPGGTIEARVGTTVVGAATVSESGAASVVATFAWEKDEAVPITLRYASAHGAFDPGEPLLVSVPVHGPSFLRRLPLVLAAMLVFGWLVLGRMERRKTPAAAPAREREPVPQMLVVAPAAKGAEPVWNGRVLDAHTGDPVPHAVLRLERTAFTQVEPLARTETDARGAFRMALPPEHATTERPQGLVLVAEGRLFARLSQPAPAFGELRIALVARRRKLLDRLVEYARWSLRGGPDPTPGELRAHARQGSIPDGDRLVEWADRVEHAAYGGDEVDAEVEAWANEARPQMPVAAAEGAPAPVEPAEQERLARAAVVARIAEKRHDPNG